MSDLQLDPEKKILDWCGHLAVPKWVDEKAYNACHACSGKMDGFIKKDKHHCRLCGQMFCSSCTQKYHVPLIFRIKNKDGPARVCFACVDGCMAEKAKAAAAEAAAASPGHDLIHSKMTQSSLATTSVSGKVASMARGGVAEIAPPDYWQEEKEFVACPKCRVGKCQSYNCRVCGIRYCDKCTSKMEVPRSFERKDKTGPSRVCDPCRFKVVTQGAKLVDKLSGAQGALKSLQQGGPPGPTGAHGKQAPPPPPTGPGGRRMSQMVKNCSIAGCAALSIGVEGKCAAHGGTPALIAPRDNKLIVKRESDGTVLAELVLPSPDTPLSTIDVLLKKTAPQSEAYSFVFRGAPIPEAFHGVFMAKHLSGVIQTRPKQRDALALAAANAASEAMGASDAVPGTNNPFKRDPAKEAALAATRVLKPKKQAKEVKVVEFKRVAPIVAAAAKARVLETSARITMAKMNGTSSAPATSAAGGGPPPLPGAAKKGPPPPPGMKGAAAELAAGGNVDVVLKSRAKAYFGAV